MDDSEKITWFHLPEAPPYVAGSTGGPGAYGGSLDGGWLTLPVGTTVTLHGIQGTWRVVRSHFHWGHPDEETGMHIFLEEDRDANTE